MTAKYQQEAPKTDLRAVANAPAKTAGATSVADFFAANKDRIAGVLPAHMTPDRLMKVALGAIRTTPALLECTTKSLLGAVIQCAQLGLEPNTILGHAYLVPFYNGKEKRRDVQIMVGYKGLIELARRSGQIVSIAAHDVCENDEFELVYGLDETLRHKPAMGDRGEIIGFYAVAKLKDGGHSFEFMNRRQVEDIRDNFSGAWKDEWVNGRKTGNRVKALSPWWEHFAEMGCKTAIRRLAKYLPLSIELATATAIDELGEAGKLQGMDSVLDGEFVVQADDAPIAEARDVQESDGAETDAAGSGPDDSGALTLADALYQVEAGEYVMALDITRSLSDAEKRHVEKAIANHSKAKAEPATEPEPEGIIMPSLPDDAFEAE